MLVHQLIYQGEHDSLVFRGETNSTYGQLQTEVERYRNYLYQAGVRKGENVGLLTRNSPAFIYAYMAIISLGAVVVPINYQLTAREVAYIVRDARMKNLVMGKSMELKEYLGEYEFQVEQHIISRINEFTIPEGSLTPCFDDEIKEEWPCAIIYTSGTTGNPKGAVLTHKNLISDTVCLTKVLPIYETDNILCILPLYHCLALTCIVLGGLLFKASMTILDTVVPKTIIEAVKKFDVTVFYGVPPVYMLLLRLATPDDLAKVHLYLSGGASLPQQTAEDFTRKFGIGITEGYGLSEASPVVTVNPSNKSKPLSIGKPLPGVKVQVVDEQGQVLPAGMVGELTVKGPNVMLGYFNLPEETAKTLRGGWLHTGDLAYQDEDGYLFIVDRLKDMIITNGENIYPREIEELLYKYPGISEASVVGVPDGLRGQAVCAYIVMQEGAAFDKKAIKEYLRNKMAAYKLPRDFIEMNALPKNQSGKILKRLLREQGSSSH
jgi:long-chain acyl-CoA synthetase